MQIFILSLQDFRRLNLSRFRHGGVNVTGFQLLDRQQQSVLDLRRTLLNGKGLRGYHEKDESDIHTLPVRPWRH